MSKVYCGHCKGWVERCRHLDVCIHDWQGTTEEWLKPDPKSNPLSDEELRKLYEQGN